MNIFLAIQSTYDDVEIALCTPERIIEQQSIKKVDASSKILVYIQQLLNKHDITLSHLNFIATNQGPGPFTTLRVVIASVNGLGFARQIPLVGIDALDAMLNEYSNSSAPTTIALLNAFSQDVYFALKQPHKPTSKGYENIYALLNRWKNIEGDVHAIGNGVLLYKQAITDVFGKRVYIQEPLTAYCSISSIAKLGYDQWKMNIQPTFQLQPLYLKGSPVYQNPTLLEVKAQ